MIKTIELFLNYLQSTETAQKYLFHCYKQQQISDYQKLSYQNSDRFFYYIKHGLLYYQTANHAATETQPLFYFYGMTHLIKACLLSEIPNYPHSTSLLAHGLSTRKRKKQHYDFLQDEVKIQSNGLFPYFSANLFHVKQWPTDKFSMETMLKTIPEMNALFCMHSKQTHLIKVANRNETKLNFPLDILDTYHLSQERFLAKLTPYILTNKIHADKEKIYCELEHPISILAKGPFFYHLDENSIYFALTNQLPNYSHEIIHHYILLYNLSMIARYETEWWGDLLHTTATKDYPFIKNFLDITSRKIPVYLGHFLYQKQF
ncbi:hypothetical protein GCM10011351_31690 [Paraliobacillus quinghaiensis]|uniref:YaaC-like Protein n=1 Tax=Paraliobacillus quinghaiensis TaxID=470815 RepID=A0A917WZL6_9BACI|nr:YaaC family protein [Paraliobacillus quinghaiensis]GGM43372.1 hypothetical protein GCM10011351_31690 [Paraliobacillus quinghaiensis]